MVERRGKATRHRRIVLSFSEHLRRGRSRASASLVELHAPRPDNRCQAGLEVLATACESDSVLIDGDGI